MNTCKRCGAEFDGKFCPECGQKFTDKEVCSQCGSELKGNVKYCPECGYCLVPNKTRENVDNNKPTLAVRLYGILRYVPMVIALLFAVLLPLLYIAPIAEANEMTGSAESINVYSVDEDFYGVSVAYLVFMCLAILFAAIILYQYIKNDNWKKYITIFGKIRISVGELAALTAVVLIYLPCLIISAVAMGKAAELNELLGGGVADVVYAGAAPKAVLSFAVIFTVFAIGVVVARILIGKFNPELCPKAEADKAEGAKTEVKPCRRPLLYFAYLNTRLRYAVTTFFACTLISTIIIMSFFFGWSVISPHWIIVICSSVTVVAVIISLAIGCPAWSPKDFLYVVQKKSWNTEAKIGIKKIAFVLIPLAVLILILIVESAQRHLVYGRGYIMAAVYLLVSVAVYVTAKIVIAVQSGRIAEYLYGCPGPHPDSKLRIEYDEKHEIELYESYKVAKKHGIVFDGDTTKKKMLIRRIILAVSCLVFAVISAVSAVVTPQLVDKFSASYISACVTDGYYNIDMRVNFEFYCGQPNEVEKDADGNRVLIYYDDDYADLKKQLKKAQDAADDNKVQILNKKIANLTFSSLVIYYYYTKDKDNNYEIPEKIALNTKTIVGKSASSKKSVESAKLFNAKYTVGRGYTSDKFYAEIFYTDGSYKFELVPTSVFSDIDFNKKGKQTVKWSDEWGSYSATVKSE